MQTTGASLLAVKRRSLSRVWATAQVGHSTHGLLYLAAVLNDSCQPKRHQDRVDIKVWYRVLSGS
jgi:hypothetical protein